MNRPIYETPDSLKAEGDLADKVKSKLLPGWELVKLPIRYRLDYAVLDDQGIIRRFYELKCRTCNMHDYFTYMLSAEKFMTAKQYIRDLGVPCSLIVRWKDMDGWANLKYCDYSLRVGGRKDRNDSQDIEPVVHIPIEEFNFIE